MLVQITVSGQYMENYGAHSWNGIGQCPQYWKCKGDFTRIVMCNVPIVDVPSVMADLNKRIDDFSERSQGSSYDAYCFNLQPNKLSHGEQVEWAYKCFDEIQSIPQSEVQAFLTAFGREEEVDPPADRFDTVVA